MAKDSNGGAGISPSTGGVMPSAQSNPPVNVPIGTGSRPGKSRYPIETTAPADAKTMGRSVPGALK